MDRWLKISNKEADMHEQRLKGISGIVDSGGLMTLGQRALAEPTIKELMLRSAHPEINKLTDQTAQGARALQTLFIEEACRSAAAREWIRDVEFMLYGPLELVRRIG
jgi:hypothetical protein